jgi:hypothetical protein
MTKSLSRIATELSEISRLAGQLLSARWHHRLVPLLGVVVLLTNIPLHAQTAKTGEPQVNDISGNPINSPIFLDAKQYQTTGVDMCQAIANACSNSLQTPHPTTIDARGFTGAQVCAPATVTLMLNSCSGNGGGKLLLGTVSVYADGPAAGATGHYSDVHLSGIGTPPFLIPSKFWGIEGVSRGDPGATDGTWLSICIGQNNPVGTGHISPGPGSGPCNQPFPKRTFPIVSTTVSTAGGVTSMAIAVTANLTAANIYLGELAMVKGGLSGPPPSGNNGTFAVQSFTGNGGGGGNSFANVTVPANTASCGPPSNCGTLFLGTPILGFTSTSKAYNDSSCFSGLCSGFGEHIKNLGFDCQTYDGCIGWQNLYAEEESGADTFHVANYNFVGFDVHGFGSQNFGPILNAEIYTGTGNTTCAEGTTGAYIGDAEMRGLDGWTINNSGSSGSSPACGSTPVAAVLFDAPNTEVLNGHCEGFLNCVVLGANNPSGSGGHVTGIVGGPSGNSGNNVVQISANYSTTNGKYVIERIRRNFHTNGIMDNINNVTLTDNFIALYSYAGIRAGAIFSAVPPAPAPANTDLAGQCTLSAGTCTYQFSQTYSSSNPPICTCTDTAATAGCRVQVMGAPLTLTITGTGTHLINYICIGRN